VSILRRAATWIVLAGAVMSALMVRFLSSQLLEWFQTKLPESRLTRLPAVTERFLASPWYFTALPLALAAIAGATVIWRFQTPATQESKYHDVVLIAGLLLYSSLMIQMSTILAFVILPAALSGI
jgi:hypothetical protein